MVAAAVMWTTAMLVGGGQGGSVDVMELEFAAAGELVVEDLEYAADVTVMQAEGDEGAVILWMEDV